MNILIEVATFDISACDLYSDWGSIEAGKNARAIQKGFVVLF